MAWNGGFLCYFRFIIKRERWMSLVWIISITGSALLFAGMYPGLFPDKESMLIMASTMNTPAMVALMGPVYAMESINISIIMAQECLIWFAITVAVMNIFFVNRHTRMDEELGRHEMLRALPVGRLTGVSATLFGAFVLNAVISLIIAFGLIVLDLEGATAAGAFTYALSIGAQGLLFASLTLLAAQMFSTSRGVAGCSFALLGLFYIMRMSGDISGNILNKVSPMGLGLQVFAFYEDNFLPVWILAMEAVLVGVTALFICAGRDLGEGILPARRGKEHASRFLQGEFGLAWRLSRGTILAWGIAMLVMGATYGSVLGQIDTFVNDNEMFKKILNATGTYDLANNYIVLIFAIGALLSSVPVITLACKIHSEEKHGRLEQIYSKSVPRQKMYLSYIILAFAESIIAPVLMAFGFYAAAQGLGNIELGMLMKAALVYLPALWTMLGLCVLLIGTIPRLTSFVWVVFSFSFIMMYFGRLLDIPAWVHRFSPFDHIPQMPVEEFAAVPLVVMMLLSGAFLLAGIVRYVQRDIG